MSASERGRKSIPRTTLAYLEAKSVLTILEVTRAEPSILWALTLVFWYRNLAARRGIIASTLFCGSMTTVFLLLPIFLLIGGLGISETQGMCGQGARQVRGRATLGARGMVRRLARLILSRLVVRLKACGDLGIWSR